jgi:hypothetical protein
MINQPRPAGWGLAGPEARVVDLNPGRTVGLLPAEHGPSPLNRRRARANPSGNHKEFGQESELVVPNTLNTMPGIAASQPDRSGRQEC